MLDSILQLLFSSLIAIQIIFWLLYAFLVLPTLGDREIKVTYSLRHVLLNTFIDKYVDAYFSTLDPAARKRWHNFFIRYAMRATFSLLVLYFFLLFVGHAIGA
ncbi:hypothetical protein [Arenimonas sp.]|uniref:hypothetical protein n=1 Tax=Arenimonas sp. TaxID=1872635 RepID=UPI0025BB40A4|nr:hypothetical protein [Arenimonas sp.]